MNRPHVTDVNYPQFLPQEQYAQPRGIPCQYDHDPWGESIEAGIPLDVMIAKEAVARLFGPIDAVNGQIYEYMTLNSDQGMLSELSSTERNEMHQRARKAAMLLQDLRWAKLHVAIEIAVRVMRHLPAPTMSLEAMFQTALADAGMGTIAGANEMIQQVYAGGHRRSITRIWKHFDPTGLTILKPYGLADANMDIIPGAAATAD